MQQMVLGVKQYMGEKDRIPKLLITFNILWKLMSLYPSPIGIGLINYRAAICLAVPALLCSGKFTVHNAKSFDPETHLTCSSIHFMPSFTSANFIILTIPSSNTDPFHKGISLFLSVAPGCLTCPVSSLKTFYLHNPQPPKSPLFINDSGLPLLHTELIGKLREDLSVLGFDASKFSGHSFQQGGASSAAAAGFSDFELQQLGRWKSDVYKLYIKPNQHHLLSLSAHLHWAIPLTQPPKPQSLPFTS